MSSELDKKPTDPHETATHAAAGNWHGMASPEWRVPARCAIHHPPRTTSDERQNEYSHFTERDFATIPNRSEQYMGSA